ncbi:hypothetical protein [Labrys neptuniae]
MARRIRIPLLIDILEVDDAASIDAINQDPRLDRAYGRTGPLFNRMLAARLMRVFRLDGALFPTMLGRTDAARASAQAALAARLQETPVPDLADDDAMVAYVRGAAAREKAGPALQRLVGRLFDPAFTPAEGEAQRLWDAAIRFDAAARSPNPLRWLQQALFGTLHADRNILAGAVGRDPMAIHAIGIALHNIMKSLDRLRECHDDPVRRFALDGRSAAIAALAAPDAVLRQAKAVADVPGGSLTPGTLVQLKLADAAERRLDPAIAFQSPSWNACPAAGFVARLLAAIWIKARAKDEQP